VKGYFKEPLSQRKQMPHEDMKHMAGDSSVDDWISSDIKHLKMDIQT